MSQILHHFYKYKKNYYVIITYTSKSSESIYKIMYEKLYINKYKLITNKIKKCVFYKISKL